jgi:hypothetical protein
MKFKNYVKWIRALVNAYQDDILNEELFNQNMKYVLDTAFHEDNITLNKYEFELITCVYDLLFDLVRKSKESIADCDFDTVELMR